MQKLSPLALTAAAAAALAFTVAPTPGGALASPGAADLAHHEDGHAHDKKDIVATAQEAGDFNTLLAAAKAAGLAETLQGDGPLTLLAPTDEAFDALPEGTVADLLKPENKQKLTDILLYHVVDGEVPAKDVMGMSEFTTMQGEKVQVQVDGDTVMLNDATVTSADVMASNGVIHVIDTVLMPEG